MNAQYRKLDGTPVNDLAEYVKEYLTKHPEVALSVGSDSQNIGGTSLYATVVAFRHPGKGVHFVLTKKREPLNSDIITRLFKESEDSIETAEYLRSRNINHPITIDVDYNEDEQFKSQVMVCVPNKMCKLLPSLQIIYYEFPSQFTYRYYDK